MKVRKITTKPEQTGVKLVLSMDEANLLVTFLGPTMLKNVKGILPAETDETHDKVNGLLYDIYNSLTDNGVERY